MVTKTVYNSLSTILSIMLMDPKIKVTLTLRTMGIQIYQVYHNFGKATKVFLLW